MNEKETHPTQRNGFKILLLFVPLCLVLFWCTHEEDYVGTYKCKHEYGEESITLYPDHSFLQIFADSNGVDSNEGRWRTESNMLVLKGRIMYVSPIQFKNANNVFGVGKKRTSYVLVSRGCIIVELDFPEFNLCKE